MAEYKIPDKEDYVSCPYNETHMVPYKTMQTHLIKCRRNHLHLDMETCPFNARHRVPRVEFLHHKSTCPNRVALQKEVIHAQHIEQNDGSFFSGDCSVPSYKTDHAAAICSENWDDDLPENPQAFVFGVTSIGSSNSGVELDSEWNNIPHSKQRSQADLRRPNTASLTLIGRGRGLSAAVKKPGTADERGGQQEKSTALLQSMARGRGVGRANQEADIRPGEAVQPKQDTEKVTAVVRPLDAKPKKPASVTPPVVNGMGRGAQATNQQKSVPRGVAQQIMISSNQRPGQNASIQTTFTAAKAQGRGRGITALLGQSATGFVVPNVNKTVPPERPQPPSGQQVGVEFEDFENGYNPPGRYEQPSAGASGADPTADSQSFDDLDDFDNGYSTHANTNIPDGDFEDFDNGYNPNVNRNQHNRVLEDFDNGYNPKPYRNLPAEDVEDFDNGYNPPAKGFQHVEGLQNGFIPRSGRNQKPGRLDNVDIRYKPSPNLLAGSDDSDEFSMPVAAFGNPKGKATAASEKAKELRKLNKKLRAIEDLEKKRAHGCKLDPDQIQKLAGKDDILRMMETLSSA